MTKILYLPTGRYLKFYSYNANKNLASTIRTEIIENTAYFVLDSKNNIDNFLFWLTDGNNKGEFNYNPTFLQANSIEELPITRNLIEVIND